MATQNENTLDKLRERLTEARDALAKIQKKNNRKRNFGTAASVCVFLTPFVAIGGGLYTAITGGNLKKSTLNYDEKTVFDTYGNVSSILLEQDRKDKSEEEFVKVYDPYTLTSDGKYSRAFRIYSGEDFTKDDVQALIDGNISNMEEVFGSHVITGSESRVSVDDYSQVPQIEATVYTVSDDTYEGYDPDKVKERFWQGFGVFIGGVAGAIILLYGSDLDNPRKDESLAKKIDNYLMYSAFKSYDEEIILRNKVDDLEQAYRWEIERIAEDSPRVKK